MRDDDDYDDDDPGDDSDERAAAPRPRCPGIVMAAGVIWLCIGGLSVLNMILAFVQAGAAAGAGVGVGCCPALFAGLIAFAFLNAGYQLIKGKSKDLQGNSIGSILLGLLQLAAGIFIAVSGAVAFQNQNAQKLDPEILIIIGAFVCFMGLTLVVAGILGLVGRNAYREWRKAAFPERLRRTPRRRRRRRRDDDEEEEDD